jgi:hypothetical protein
VELFFQWIKQHLRIAVSTCVLATILKKRLDLGLSLYKILQILSVAAFEKTPILQGFSGIDEAHGYDSRMQLYLFNL